jgi:transketolase
VRNSFANTFYELGKLDSRLAVVVADISPAGSIARFREDFPERFINTGVAEQVMIGLAAGMAQRGMRPFAYTIATFALYRPFEMIRDDLCYQDLPVTVVGIGGGVTYSTLGATHHAMEDVAIASALPNMTVVAPCDPLETAAMTRHLAIHNQHPAYLRLAKAGEPDLTSGAAEPFVFGRPRLVRPGRRTCFLAYGPIPVKMALDLSDRVAARDGEPAAVYSVHTLKPLDSERIARLFKEFDHLVVLEEHVPRGGLGSSVKELAWDERAPCRLSHYSLQDSFIHTYGDHKDVLAAHGFDIENVAAGLGLR